MKIYQQWLKQITKLGVLLVMGVSMSACGSSSDKWKEEVMLHDGSNIVVERSQVFAGRHELEQSPPIKEHSITFIPPGANKSISWKSELTPDIGHSNFDLLALDIVKGKPYIVTSPTLCLAYNKWGRPNPPYIIFKYANQQWKQIPLAELPTEITRLNMLIDTYGHHDVEQEVKSGFVSADSVKKLNGTLTQPEFQTILRKPVKSGVDASSVNCEELVYYKGAWVGPGDSIGKRMMDQKSK